MKIEVSEINAVKKSLQVELDSEDVADERNKTVAMYARKVQIPGFRSGKAPKAIVMQRFGKEIKEEVRDRLVARYYDRAIKEHELEPLGDPILDEVDDEEGKPFSFKVTLEQAPEIELKEYKGLEVRKPKAEVDQDEVDKTLEELRQAHASLKTEEGRKARTGDVVIADVDAVPNEGEPFNREGAMIEVGAQDNLPQFNEQVEGAEAGDELEFSIEYPPDFHVQEMAGKLIGYKVTVKEVKARVAPELDDEFAKDMGEEFGSLKDLTDRIESDLQKRKEMEAENELKRSLIDKLLLAHPALLPEVLVQEEVKHRMEDMFRAMVMQGMNPEKMDLDWKEIRDKQEEPARKSVHTRLLMDAIAEKEGLDVSTAEVDAKIKEEAERAGENYTEVRKRLKDGGGYNALQNQLVREKALDLVTSVANIQGEE